MHHSGVRLLRMAKGARWQGSLTSSAPPTAACSSWPACGRMDHPATGEPVISCPIVVTDANALTRPIHDRMPVRLEPADFGAWLEGAGGIETSARGGRQATHVARVTARQSHRQR